MGRSLPEWAAAWAERQGLRPELITEQGPYPGTAGALQGRTGLVLFGDNFYAGDVDLDFWCNPESSRFSTLYCPSDGLAVVCGNTIVEKPHSFRGHNWCFAGMAYVHSWPADGLPIGRRGEYEITDLLNMNNAKGWPLPCRWAHLSTPKDLEGVQNYVERSMHLYE